LGARYKVDQERLEVESFVCNPKEGGALTEGGEMKRKRYITKSSGLELTIGGPKRKGDKEGKSQGDVHGGANTTYRVQLKQKPFLLNILKNVEREATPN